MYQTPLQRHIGPLKAVSKAQRAVSFVLLDWPGKARLRDRVEDLRLPLHCHGISTFDGRLVEVCGVVKVEDSIGFDGETAVTIDPPLPLRRGRT